MSVVAHLLRSLGHTPAVGSAPPSPTLDSVTNDGDGDAITATVSGTGGNTCTLYTAKGGATATAGASRAGDGEIQQTGLDNDTVYHVYAVCSSGSYYSEPSRVLSVLVTDGTTPEQPEGQLGEPLELLANSLAASASFQSLVGAADAAEALRHVHYYGIDPPDTWQGSTAVELGTFVHSETSRTLILECTVAGTTGSSEPTWPAAAGDTVDDGTATWTARQVYGPADATTSSHYTATVRHSRPFAIVGIGETWESRIAGEGALPTFVNRGDLLLVLEADVPAAIRHRVAEPGHWFAGLLGNILADVQQLPPSANYLDVTSAKLQWLRRPQESEIQTEGDHFMGMLAIAWRGMP